MHVGAEAAVAQKHPGARAGIEPELSIPAGGGQQLKGPGHGELVGGHVIGNGGTVLAALQVRAIAADPGHYLHPFAVQPQGDGGDLPGVDGVEALGQHGPQPGGIGGRIAKIEPAQPRDGLLGAAGDVVQIVLHPSSEGVVDQVLEMVFQQSHQGEGGKRGHECGALLPGVTTVLDGGHDRRVGRGPPDAQLLQALDQRGFGEPSGGLGLVAFGLQLVGSQGIAFHHRWEASLVAVGVGVVVVGVLDVDPLESGVGDDGAAGRE